MKDLNAIALFVHVIRHGSFSGASRQLGIPVPTVSRRIRELERTLDVRLIERSTRRLRLTEPGLAFYEESAQGIREIENALLTLTNNQAKLTGRLRLTMPYWFTPLHQMNVEFQRTYPNIKVELYVTERKIDLIAGGFDVAIRIGKPEPMSAMARRIFEYRHCLVASPSFIKKHGLPTTPDDLIHFPCGAHYSHNIKPFWLLGNRSIRISPHFLVNEYQFLLERALSGAIITELPSFLAEPYLKRRRLRPILGNFPFSKDPVYLIYPSRNQLSRIVRVYIDFCIQHIKTYL